MKLDKFHEHEALHAAHLVLDTWNNHVAEHPYVSADPDLKRLADAASESMMALYQEVGRRQDAAGSTSEDEGDLT
ncbi:hypothetical protein KUV57_12575 [Epibacterium sp. DP7N7-1]|nr:hypothetical protein [Epibacterium sp. DP7N7-1]